LSGIGFRELAINSAPPRPAQLSALWMSVGGNTVSPSPLSGDSFTLRKAPKPSAAGAQFLRIASGEDAAANAFYAQVGGWSDKAPSSQVASESAQFAAALHEHINSLARASWPAPARGAVRSLITDMRSLLPHLGPPPAASRGTLAAWRSALAREGEAEAISGAEDTVRRILNVPFVPSS
jgi:hypothetical protein